HPLKTGGFGDVYRGRYTDSDGKQHEIALKVLRIFDSGQTEEQRRVLYAKFTKEALMWHYLKHPNVVPFLGVDSTTFPSPRRAMVSPWMAQGSLHGYVSDPENSPVGPYAIELICNVIEGLKFLHSRNVIHGDLCGRNILINDNGQACLADFGLTGFIESDTTNKETSTRQGSARWMSPELLCPPPPEMHFKRTTASDIWAFGCVCCEVQGTVEPFRQFVQDIGIALAFSKHAYAEKDAAPNATEQPYQECPADKAGNVMPDRVWELLQWCWKFDAAGRPSADLLADMLGEM
ncbi:kinase-like domain-containing protein, partial [Mycena sanguinolenta]